MLPFGPSGPENDRQVAARSSRHRPVERGGTAGKRSGGVALGPLPRLESPSELGLPSCPDCRHRPSEDDSPYRRGVAGVRSGTDEPVPVETGVAPLAPMAGVESRLLATSVFEVLQGLRIDGLDPGDAAPCSGAEGRPSPRPAVVVLEVCLTPASTGDVSGLGARSHAPPGAGLVARRGRGRAARDRHARRTRHLGIRPHAGPTGFGSAGGE